MTTPLIHLSTETAREEIDLFLDHDINFAYIALKGSNLPRNHFGHFLRPRDIQKTLKKLWLSIQPLKKDFLAFSRFQEKHGESSSVKYKKMSKHKAATVSMAIEQHAAAYIVEISRTHHFLMFMIQHYTVPSDSGELEVYDIRKSYYNLAKMLKNENILRMCDSDEISALYTFNQLRNSLVHSSSYTTFSSMRKEYYEQVIALLGEVDDIYMWLHKQLGLIVEDI